MVVLSVLLCLRMSRVICVRRAWFAGHSAQYVYGCVVCSATGQVKAPSFAWVAGPYATAAVWALHENPPIVWMTLACMSSWNVIVWCWRAIMCVVRLTDWSVCVAASAL
jgi:hypothetical protein